MTRRVAIIGAGASGLPAIKCCLDEGLQPVCFERTDSIGGLWNFTEEVREGQACVMETTVMLTSKEMSCYSDYPMPKDFPNFCHNTKVMEYFNNYCEEFGLKQFIRFRHEVLMVCKSQDSDSSGGWTIRYRNHGNMEDSQERFDFVLVCSGHHAEQKKVTFKGQGLFDGVIIHSHDVRRGSDFKNQRVVVVGVGDSAMDVTGDAATSAKQVYLSTRSGTWLFTRLAPGGLPFDMALISRQGNAMFKWFPKKLFSDASNMLNHRFDHKVYALQPNHGVFGGVPAFSDVLPGLIVCGAVIVKPDIKQLTKTGVEFDDGTFVDNIDAIICCTRYIFGFPFIDKSVIDVKDNKTNLYKYMFPPDLEQTTLAMIGCINPIGSIFPVSELQSRLATRVFKGEITLPSKDVMYLDIQQKRVAMAARYTDTTRHTMQVDYVAYMDELGEIVGCKPNLWKYFIMDNRLWRELFFGGCTSFQYRLDGPGRWERAREVILSSKERVLHPLQTRPMAPPGRDPGTTSFCHKLLLLAVVAGGLWFIGKKQGLKLCDLAEKVKECLSIIGFDAKQLN